MRDDERSIGDLGEGLQNSLPWGMDSVTRAQVFLVAADVALEATAREYGTLRRAGVLGVQHDIAECVTRLKNLPNDAPEVLPAHELEERSG